MNRSDVTLIALSLVSILAGGSFILVQTQLNKLRNRIAELTLALNKSVEVTGVLVNDYAARKGVKKAGK